MAYSKIEKHKTINDYKNGVNLDEISLNRNIPKSTIYKWIEEECSLSKKFNDLNKKIEIYRYLFELIKPDEESRLKTYKEFYLKNYGPKFLSQLLSIDKNKFYRYLNHKETMLEKYDATITPLIIEIFNKSERRFGPQKIKIKLEEKGYHVSERKISQIMKDNNLKIIKFTSKLVYPKGNHDKRLENKLQRKFIQDAPNKVWVSDVTYIKVSGLDVYLCAIMDLFSRKIVGYLVGTTNSESLILRTFRKAYFDRNNPENLLFHSDRGSNYTSIKLKKLLQICHVQQSFSNTGDPYDNAVIESFFSTFKKEAINGKEFEDIVSLKRAIDNYMNYYNSYRPHRTLNNQTPENFENLYLNELKKKSK